MTKLGDPFNPKTGEFADNIRSIVDDGTDAELKASLQQFGWVAKFPALVDEHDVCLVGHRRLKIAKELKIKPVIERLALGSGDAADAERLKIAIASNVGHKPMTNKDRQRIAEYLYGTREWTMQRIAKALGVAQSTITEDLRNLSTADKSKPAKTASNPKGAGRPKQAQKEKTRAEIAPQAVKREEQVEQLMALGKTSQEIAAEIGVGLRATNQAMEHVKIRQEAEARIDPATLSLSAQKKIEIAIRQHQRTLDLEHRRRFTEEMNDHLKDTVLPHYKMMEQKYRDLLESRTKGVMNRKTYMLILSCLHTDSRHSTSEEKLNAAFHAFTRLQTKLLSEEDDPTPKFRMPSTLAELMALKRKVAEQRRAKRAGKSDLTRR